MVSYWRLKMKILFTVLGLISYFNAYSAVCSRTITFSDGSVLTASQLNDEFNAAISCINSIDNSNISSNAAILPVKLSSTIAGDGLSRDGSTGVLSVGVDNSTVELSSDAVRVKDAGITGAKLATSAADSSTLEVASGSMRIKNSGVSTAKIANSAVTRAKLADVDQEYGAYESTTGNITSTSAVDFSPSKEVTITTTGRPVFIGLVSNSSVSSYQTIVCTGPTHASAFCSIRLVRGSTSIADFTMESFTTGTSTRLKLPISVIWHIDQPAAGTYTYKLKGLVSSGRQLSVDYGRLIAYEL